MNEIHSSAEAIRRWDVHARALMEAFSPEDLGFLDVGAFDVVVSSMVLQDLPDHQAALESFHRVLTDGGLLVFSSSHPCFTTPDCGWVRDEDGNKLYWKVDRYFVEGTYEQMLPRDTEDPVLIYHRTLSNYIRTLLRAGFELLDVIEPRPAEEMLERYPAFRDDLRMSHFIVFKARKRQDGRPLAPPDGFGYN
jgi:SAM-dependent methyltransferase